MLLGYTAAFSQPIVFLAAYHLLISRNPISVRQNRRDMSKQPQTNDDLRGHLRDHLAFLQASAASFDNGFEAEAKRMAVSVRVLVHDTDKSHALLTQLNLINQEFVDSALPYDSRSIVAHAGLVVLASGGTKRGYVAHLGGTTERRLPFEEWWSAPIFVDDQKATISRRGLVLAMANQDGGAHVDPALDETYARLSRGNSMGWMFGNETNTSPVRDVELVSMRQLTHEVLTTLVPGYSCIRPETGGVLFGGVQVFDEVPPEFLWKRSTGRNDPCPCGSGNKYKKCHGAPSA